MNINRDYFKIIRCLLLPFLPILIYKLLQCFIMWDLLLLFDWTVGGRLLSLVIYMISFLICLLYTTDMVDWEDNREDQ